MKHKDIYSKFMIEYDKANVLSSYPSLTEYEVATFLDKAYNALIALKLTGNNIRRMGFETDVKAIEDLAPLIVKEDKTLNIPINDEKSSFSDNMQYINLSKNQLYFVSAFLEKTMDSGDNRPMDARGDDNYIKRSLPIELVSHQMARKFYSNAYNRPWIKSPIGFIELNRLYVMYDDSNRPDVSKSALGAQPSYDGVCHIVYIKKPNTFLKDLNDHDKFPASTGAYTLFSPSDGDSSNTYYNFECNDSMAEELISLAIVFALENIESNRLSTKLNMRGLES